MEADALDKAAGNRGAEVKSAQEARIVFNNLGQIINADMLKEQYRQLSWQKGVGIDKITKEVYGKKLDENITDLIRRIR